MGTARRSAAGRRTECSSAPRARGTLACSFRRLAFPGRRQIDTRLPGLREADCDGLFRRSGAVPAFADVMNFLAHELAGLCRRLLAGTPGRTCAPDGRFLRHCSSRGLHLSSRPAVFVRYGRPEARPPAGTRMPESRKLTLERAEAKPIPEALPHGRLVKTAGGVGGACWSRACFRFITTVDVAAGLRGRTEPAAGNVSCASSDGLTPDTWCATTALGPAGRRSVGRLPGGSYNVPRAGSAFRQST